MNRPQRNNVPRMNTQSASAGFSAQPSTSNAATANHTSSNGSDRVQEFIRLQNPRPRILRTSNEYVDVINSAPPASTSGGNRFDSARNDRFPRGNFVDNNSAREGNFLPRVHRSGFTRGAEIPANASAINRAAEAENFRPPPPVAAANNVDGPNRGLFRPLGGRTSPHHHANDRISVVKTLCPSSSSNNGNNDIKILDDRHCKQQQILLQRLTALKSPSDICSTTATPGWSVNPSVDHRPVISTQPKKDALDPLWMSGGSKKSSQSTTTTGTTSSGATTSSIMCPRCGKCRCADCAKPRQLPSAYVCNRKCLCSADTLVDCTSCACCVKGCFYHALRDDECVSGSSGSTPARFWFKKWACLSLACLALPCLWCYLPLKGCAKCCEFAYARLHDNGCRCSSTSATAAANQNLRRRRSHSSSIDSTNRIQAPPSTNGKTLIDSKDQDHVTAANKGGSRSRTPSRSRYEHLERRLLMKSNSAGAFAAPPIGGQHQQLTFSPLSPPPPPLPLLPPSLPLLPPLDNMQISPLIDVRTDNNMLISNNNTDNNHKSKLSAARSLPYQQQRYHCHQNTINPSPLLSTTTLVDVHRCMNDDNVGDNAKSFINNRSPL